MSLASPLRVAALVSLATLAFAALVGLIAVLDAGSTPSAAGKGIGIALTVFAVGATIACALACLGRRAVELPALAAVVVAGVALDLLVLAIWLDIRSDAYGKVVAVAFAWTLIALIVLGLTLAIRPSGQLTRALYLATVTSAVAAGLLSTWLIVGRGDTSNPLGSVGDDGLLRALGAAFVLLATLWVASLAARRLESDP